jgi:ABC-type Fe3+ transport system substrate-binding protein
MGRFREECMMRVRAIAAALLVLAMAAGGARAADLPPAVAALLPQAKAEGLTANIFGISLDPAQIAAFNKSISAFYGVPITLNMTGSLHPQKAAELVQGAKMGVASGIDIFWTASAIAGTLEKADLIAPFDWVSAFGLDPAFREGTKGLRLHDGTLAGVIYNTQLLKPDQAPKSYPAVVDNPKLKGRIALPRAPNVFIFMAYAIGDAAAQNLVKQLMGPQQARILPTYPDVQNRVMSGEFAIGLGVDSTMARRRGAPVANAPIDPVVLTPWAAWLMKDAKHPATGKLFGYWASSPQGQRTLWDVDGIARVTTPDTDLAKLAEKKKVVLVPHDYMVETLPKLVPVYSRLMGLH